MEVSQISQFSKVLELATDKNLLNTAMQVGIPSIVAIVGLVVNYLQFKSHEKKDIRLALISKQKDLESTTFNRKGNLIEKISLQLNKLHEHGGNYVIVLTGKLRVESDSFPVKDKYFDQLNEFLVSHRDMMFLNSEIETSVLLLGSNELREAYETYRTKFNCLVTEFPPTSASVGKEEKLISYGGQLNDQYKDVFRELSKLYLASDNTELSVQ